MGKNQNDLIKAELSRKAVTAQLSKNGVHLRARHKFRKFQKGYNATRNNTNLKRTLETDGESGMGYDYVLEVEGCTRSIYLLIRWYKDRDVYIKESRTGDLIENFKNEDIWFLFLEYPLDKDLNIIPIKSFRFKSFDEMMNEHGNWVQTSDTDGNRNRRSLFSGGERVRPTEFKGTPLRGMKKGVDWFYETQPDFWTTAKALINNEKIDVL